MSTLPYGLEWWGRNLSKKSRLNCWGPAHRAGGAINTCEPTDGHSQDHEKRRKIWILEFLCGLLTFKKNGKGQPFAMKEGERIEAVRGFFDGGVSSSCKGHIENKVGPAYVIQVAERIEDEVQVMQKNLPNDATVTQAECTAAVETARAICCLARKGCMCYDLDGNIIEHYNESKTRKRDVMGDDFEGRWKRKEKDTRLPNSSSTSK